MRETSTDWRQVVTRIFQCSLLIMYLGAALQVSVYVWVDVVLLGLGVLWQAVRPGLAPSLGLILYHLWGLSTPIRAAIVEGLSWPLVLFAALHIGPLVLLGLSLRRPRRPAAGDEPC